MKDELELVINEMQGNLDEGTSTTTASKKQKPIELKCIGVMGDDWSRNPPPGICGVYGCQLCEKAAGTVQ